MTTELTSTQIADLMKSERPWNVARRVFASYAAQLSKVIDEAGNDATIEEVRATNLKIRRLEFAAVEAIGRAIGVLIGDVGSGPARPGADPEGLKRWLAGKGAEPGRPEPTGPAGKPPLGPENLIATPSEGPGKLPE